MTPMDKANYALSLFCTAAMHRFNDQLPPHLFHYTTQAGFEGILGSGRMWASEVKNLNDAAELRYSVSVFRALVERARATEYNIKIRPLFSEMQRLLSATEYDDVYIISLVTDGDNGHLWNLYGDHGAGFSLTFPTTLPLEWNEGWYLVKCRYGDNELVDFCRSAIGLFRAIYEAALNEPSTPTAEEYAANFLYHMRWFAPMFKLSAWSDEAEWRLFKIAPKTEAKYRSDGRKYIVAPANQRIKLGAAAFGPRCQPMNVLHAINAAKAGGYGELPIHFSRHILPADRQAVTEAIQAAQGQQKPAQ